MLVARFWGLTKIFAGVFECNSGESLKINDTQGGGWGGGDMATLQPSVEGLGIEGYLFGEKNIPSNNKNGIQGSFYCAARGNRPATVEITFY